MAKLDLFPFLTRDAIARAISGGIESLRSCIGSVTWGPASRVARLAVLSTLARIQVGTLLLVDEVNEKRYVFGQRLGGKIENAANGLTPREAGIIPRVEVVVKDDAFWMRLFLFADMGFAESYMLSEFECRELTSFFQLFILNRKYMGNGATWFSRASNALSNVARSTNTLSNALLNASAHYDISNEMFAAFLSPDMTYSCPIWSKVANDQDESLENAQRRKLLRFIEGCKIKATDHVLEIGTGWGSFAIEAIRRTGCRVTTITLSKAQMALAKERAKQAGVSSRIDIQLLDYRNLPEPPIPFDKIVSIEMLEVVGMEYLSTYFDLVHKLLKPDGGIAMFQCSTMPEGRQEAYAKSGDFISRYIFPGACLPSITQLLDNISEQSQGTLIVEKVENLGGHYVKTLRLWRENFLQNFDSKIRPALIKAHPDMEDEEIKVFERKWEYYFTYCEAGFVTKTLGVGLITVAREGTLAVMEGIPL